MAERPMCEGCGRPMPLTDEERRAAVDREFWEFEVTGVLGPELARAAAERTQPTGSQTQGGQSNGWRLASGCTTRSRPAAGRPAMGEPRDDSAEQSEASVALDQLEKRKGKAG